MMNQVTELQATPKNILSKPNNYQKCIDNTMGGVHLKTALRLVLPLILGQLNKLNFKGENQDCHAFMVLNPNQFYIHGW